MDIGQWYSLHDSQLPIVVTREDNRRESVHWTAPGRHHRQRCTLEQHTSNNGPGMAPTYHSSAYNTDEWWHMHYCLPLPCPSKRFDACAHAERGGGALRTEPLIRGSLAIGYVIAILLAKI